MATGHLHQTNHVSDILSSLTTCKGNWCQYVLLKEEEAEIGLWSCCLLTQTVGHRFRYSYLMLGSGGLLFSVSVACNTFAADTVGAV